MTEGVSPSEESYLDDDERKRLESEQARDAPKKNQRKKDDVAESSTKPKEKNIHSAASVPNTQEVFSETPEEGKAMRPKPKPKPRKKKPDVPQSSTMEPKPQPEGNTMMKSQTRLPNDYSCGLTDVDEVMATTESVSTVRESPCECNNHLLHFYSVHFGE